MLLAIAEVIKQNSSFKTLNPKLACAGLCCILGLDGHREVHVKVVLVLVAEVGEGLRLLRVVVHKERFQGLHGDHPGGDGGAQILKRDKLNKLKGLLKPYICRYILSIGFYFYFLFKEVTVLFLFTTGSHGKSQMF